MHEPSVNSLGREVWRLAELFPRQATDSRKAIALRRIEVHQVKLVDLIAAVDAIADTRDSAQFPPIAMILERCVEAEGRRLRPNGRDQVPDVPRFDMTPEAVEGRCAELRRWRAVYMTSTATHKGAAVRSRAAEANVAALPPEARGQIVKGQGEISRSSTKALRGVVELTIDSYQPDPKLDEIEF